MSQEKLNSNLLGEDPNEGTAPSNHRRKWQSKPISAKRYHELANTESQKDSLAKQLLKNLSYTKRNVSELIEKGKMTEWLKINSSKTSFDFSGMSSDSGVSLCTLGDHEDGQDWQNMSCSLANNNTALNKWNIDDITSSEPPNTAGALFPNSLSEVNDGKNDYDDLKDFYTPRSCWEEVGNFNDDNHSPINPISGLRSSVEEPVSLSKLPGPKRVGRSADILARVQKSPSFSTKPEVLIEERNDEGIDKSVTTARLNRPGGSITSFGRSQALLSKNKACVRKLSERCLKLKGENSTPELESSENNIKSSNEKKSEHSAGIAKSLIHLAQIKRSNKNAVAKFLKNLATCNNESPDQKGSQSNFTDQENNKRQDFSVYNSSNECLKWNFPNSNRKREEKLRSLGKEADYNLSTREESDNSENVPSNEITTLTNRYNFDTVFNEDDTQSTLLDSNKIVHESQSDFKISSSIAQRYVPTTVPEASIVMLPGHMGHIDSSNETIIHSKNIREMNTQAALIYLSETLIESAQRAEMLLMQKMKEYNDLVCREPPQKRTQDFTCQVQTLEPQPDSNFETKLNYFKDKLTQELEDKNIRIKQLESEKKKLRQALKKLNLSVGKKCEGALVNGRDIDGGGDNLTARSLSSDQSTLKERNENQEEFVQALKIENNLLHTLLKEMKAELDQENATILSLAKKLELSLGKQTIVKSRQQTDVVRELEDRLEQQEKLLKQEAVEARAVAKYVIMKYKKLIHEYKQKVICHQETVDKLTNAIK